MYPDRVRHTNPNYLPAASSIFELVWQLIALVIHRDIASDKQSHYSSIVETSRVRLTTGYQTFDELNICLTPDHAKKRMSHMITEPIIKFPCLCRNRDFNLSWKPVSWLRSLKKLLTSHAMVIGQSWCSISEHQLPYILVSNPAA